MLSESPARAIVGDGSPLRNRTGRGHVRADKTESNKTFFRKHWFLIGVVFVIIFASLMPSLGRTGGILKPEIVVKKLAVMLIFFCSGLSTDVSKMANALTRIDFYSWVLCMNLVGTPIIMYMVTSLLNTVIGMDKLVLRGLQVVAALPPPVSSAVILTRAAGGSTPLAICASVLGSLIGIFSTPLMLLMILNVSSTAGNGIIFKICLTVVFPLIGGQVARVFILKTNRFDISKLPVSMISNCTLLLIIYSAFCDMFSKDIEISKGTVFFTAFCIVAMQSFLLFTMYKLSLSSYCNFSKEDTVAAMFSATHKSLTLGLPLLNLMFGAGSKELSILSIPLLIYHPSQIMLGSILVPSIKTWLGTSKGGVELVDLKGLVGSVENRLASSGATPAKHDKLQNV